MNNKTHYRAAFKSPYLSSADLVGPIVLTIKNVALEPDKSKRTKDKFNTCHFVEKEIRSGELLKPMILNAVNSKTLKNISGSPYIEDWCGLKITIFVDPNVRFGRDTVEGLRINPISPRKKIITPENLKAWDNAKSAYLRDGNIDKVLNRVEISEDHQKQLIQECSNVA